MQEKQPHIVDVIFVLALFGLFALSAMALIITGSGIYQNTVNNMKSNYETRTSSSYVTEKVRQGNGFEEVEIAGTDALAVKKEVAGTSYITYLYSYDGYLRELFISADKEFTDSLLPAGQKITELSSMSIDKKSDKIIEIILYHEDNSSNKLLLNTYSGE